MPDFKGMSAIWTWIRDALTSEWVMHSARSAVAAAASLLAARAFGPPESYWAAITTVIVLQSALSVAWTISLKRLAGTALGACIGALLAQNFGPSVIALAGGILVAGLICAILHLDRAAYRFAGITMTIVMVLVPGQSPWTAAIHRFLEVSIGIAVGLILTAIWPEKPHGVIVRQSVATSSMRRWHCLRRAFGPRGPTDAALF